jgi:hypothetical protein
MSMYGLRGFEDDPAAVLNQTIQDAKDKLGTAGWWAVAILAGVAFLAFSGPSRRR